MRKPFLSIVTRCCKRPRMLGLNMASLDAQSNKSIEQVFIVDHVGRGIAWANQQLYTHRHRVHGRYVYILDDDNRLVSEKFVARVLGGAVAFGDPEIFVVSGTRPTADVKRFPDERAWKSQTLRKETTNAHCYVVRADVWKKHIKSFGYPPTLSGAWQFPKALIAHGGYHWVWMDVLGGESIQLGRGRVETDEADWWQQVLAAHPDIKCHDLYSGKAYWRELWSS